jgi:hypothetical protein
VWRRSFQARGAVVGFHFDHETRKRLSRTGMEAKFHATSRYGHRDATMILIGYRHSLRSSGLCDLQWSQVELAT